MMKHRAYPYDFACCTSGRSCCRNGSPGGFTLLEVAAAILILSFMLSSVFVAFHRSGVALYERTIEDRALAVAQRQMEYLIAAGKEPNSVELDGIDELDPLFKWQFDLRRETFGGLPLSKESPIRARLQVQWDEGPSGRQGEMELVRYYATLTPSGGKEVAVPVEPTDMSDLLSDCLGREATPDEAIAYMNLFITLQREPTCEELKQALLGIPAESDEEPDGEITK